MDAKNALRGLEPKQLASIRLMLEGHLPGEGYECGAEDLSQAAKELLEDSDGVLSKDLESTLERFYDEEDEQLLIDFDETILTPDVSPEQENIVESLTDLSDEELEKVRTELEKQ